MTRSPPIFAVVAVACAGGGSPGATAPSGSSAPLDVPADRMAGQKVFDASGKELSCEPPQRGCEPPEVPTEFKDRCKLGGFRLMQCGCASVCTGSPTTGKAGYDAQNRAKPCAEEQKDCTPPDTSAAFQDACTESGHKFMVCGCEWLCSGKLKQPVSGGAPEE